MIAVADILENLDKTSKVLADKAPDLADAIGDARVLAECIQAAGLHEEQPLR